MNGGSGASGYHPSVNVHVLAVEGGDVVSGATSLAWALRFLSPVILQLVMFLTCMLGMWQLLHGKLTVNDASTLYFVEVLSDRVRVKAGISESLLKSDS